MDTIKIIASLSPYESWFSDVLMAELAGQGFESFVETGNGFEAYIPEKCFSRVDLTELFDNHKERFSIEWKEETIPDQNWNEVWEKNYFRPLVIEDQIVVRAPFHSDFPDCPIQIVIEPNMAFGTGNHETTSLMMESMLHMDFTGKAVLDMGCGTGILSILASKLGAEAITAVDIDHWSFDAVSENLIINKAPNITPLLGDASTLGSIRYDIVLVNIQKNVILNDMCTYATSLRNNGIILFSGFFESDLSEIKQAATARGLTFLSSKAKNKWTVAIFRSGN